MRTTLEKVAKLYDLVEEMREVIKELREVQVDVQLGRDNDYRDPLATDVAIRVTLKPGCRNLDAH